MVINPFYYSVGTRVRERPFIKMLKPEVGDCILDVGCGLGYFTDLMSKRGAQCVGVDLDDKCIEYCKEKMRGEYVLSDINCLPFPDNHFNKVLCTEVLEHTNHNDIVLKELQRIIQPGGVIVLSVPCSEGMFKSLFKRIGHNSVDANSREYHWHKGYSRSRISNLLAAHGFRVEAHCYTLVSTIEAFMGLSKIVVQLANAKKIDSQANALLVEGTRLWKVYIKLFPVVMLAAKIEQPLSKVFKGHMIIVKGVCQK